MVQWEWQAAGGMSTGCPPDYSSPVNLTGIAFWFSVLPNLEASVQRDGAHLTHAQVRRRV
jgi:hypothetical protein